MTDTKMRDEGARSISEMLKVNTTLTSLNLYGKEEERNEKEKEKKEIKKHE